MVEEENPRKYSLQTIGSMVVMLLLYLLQMASPIFAGTVPNTIGVWNGNANGTAMNCQDSAFNGPFTGTTSIQVTAQTGSNFSGTALTTESTPDFEFSETLNFSGTLAPTWKF